MALSNKVWRQGEFVPPGAEPGLTKPFMWRDIEQEKATRDIAALRFNYPDRAHSGWKTITNRPARQVGVRINDDENEMAFPDIVVLNDPANDVAIIGEVETHRSLRETPEAELVAKWRTFASLGPLYVFAPLMRIDQVRRIAKQNTVELAGIRSWRYIFGQDKLDVTDM